ncbi:SNHG17 isoform 7 [Pan troglodytes]|uniref:SNHG17 isoform 7 n=1 Tax=Pan troglodytes TaxID=9598 RepID=A0A2J8MKP6_PANTR|nr:SNHG17 isoform 7 [Pan troglodytes]
MPLGMSHDCRPMCVRGVLWESMDPEVPGRDRPGPSSAFVGLLPRRCSLSLIGALRVPDKDPVMLRGKPCVGMDRGAAFQIQAWIHTQCPAEQSYGVVGDLWESEAAPVILGCKSAHCPVSCSVPGETIARNASIGLLSGLALCPFCPCIRK